MMNDQGHAQTDRDKDAFSLSGNSEENFLAGGGELGARIRAKDWAQTPLGPVEGWQQSLKTIVRIMLTSRQPIWIGWGKDLIKLYNDPYKAIAGGKHPEALGQPASVVWRDIWKDIEPMLKQVMEKNEGTYVESQLLIMERYGYPEETYYTFSYSPVPDDHGGIGGMICYNTDDTQRVIGERQLALLRILAAETAEARTLQEACERSAKSLEHNPFDIPFALLYIAEPDQQTLRLAGTTNISADNPTIPQVARDKKAVLPFDKVIKTGKPVVIPELGNVFGLLPSGAWGRPPHQAIAVPIPQSGGSGQAGVLLVGLNPFRKLDDGYLGFLNLVAGQIASSITNALAYEEERKRVQALAEIDRAKTLFFSNVSHEFRTPLTLMLGPIEDILNDPDTISINQERMAIAHRNALRLLKLVNALLDFSRIEAGRMQAVYEPVDLAGYTADLASGFRSAIEKAGMELVVDCAKLSEPVYVDREMWEKIVLNLMSNAFKYTLAGQISVSLRQKRETIELAVRDTGVGIPEEELPHMFERFHRVKGIEGRTQEGTGIGLSLVQELVKLHGGTITVTSTYGAGSEFTVSFPRGTNHLPQERISGKRTLVSTALGTQVYVDEALRWLPGHEELAEIISDLPIDSSTPSWRSDGERIARILLADDNADMREYVQKLLRGRYDVTAVGNGRSALAAALSNPPDLVLTDVMMPELDGFGLLQALRSAPATRSVPVIMLSARAGEEARSEGIEAGADDYLVKPFSARELLARVGTHLEMAEIRRKAQAATESERRRLYDLFMQAPAAVAILRGAEYTIELANPVTRQLWGRTSEDLINKLLFEALPEARGQGLEQLLEGVLTTGRPYVGSELKVALNRTGEGNLEDVYFTFVYSPLRNEQSEIEGIMVFAYEVTEQVIARERVEELVQQKDEFIGIASHELKTPVTSLKAYTQVLQHQFAKSGNEKAVLQLAKMDAQLDKLTNLIGDLLDVTKIDAGKLRYYEEEFDFDELIDEIVEHVQLTTQQHTIQREGTTGATIYGDRDRTGQVLMNLLTNAVKYSPRADRVIIRSAATETAVTVCVQDFGIGIPKEMHAKIFERFYRVSGEGKDTYSGLGLGLYITAEIVKRQGGTIWLESEAGQGSTFCFSLPTAQGRTVHEQKEE